MPKLLDVISWTGLRTLILICLCDSWPAALESLPFCIVNEVLITLAALQVT